MRTDVPQSLSSTVPLFTSPYVSQSRCSSTLYSPVPMFPSPFLPPQGTPYVSQSLCFPVSLLPSPYVPQSPCSPIPLFPSPDVPLKCFQSLCSSKIFPVPMFPSPGEHRDWGISLGNLGTGNTLGEHQDWGTKGLVNIWTGEYLWGV